MGLMSQPQPSSLPYWRTRAVEVGHQLALKEAALHIDSLNEVLGRRQDRKSGERFGFGLVGFLLGIALCVVKGCTTIDAHAKVEGWPDLMVVEHYVSHSEMRDRCAKYAPWGTAPEACAEFNFAERRCDIWFSADFPPTKAVIEHEWLHCRGYQHVGDNSMELFLQRFKEASR